MPHNCDKVRIFFNPIYIWSDDICVAKVSSIAIEIHQFDRDRTNLVWYGHILCASMRSDETIGLWGHTGLWPVGSQHEMLWPHAFYGLFACPYEFVRTRTCTLRIPLDVSAGTVRALANAALAWEHPCDQSACGAGPIGPNSHTGPAKLSASILWAQNHAQRSATGYTTSV